jgi:hypothetical protein
VLQPQLAAQLHARSFSAAASQLAQLQHLVAAQLHARSFSAAASQYVSNAAAHAHVFVIVSAAATSGIKDGSFQVISI